VRSTSNCVSSGYSLLAQPIHGCLVGLVIPNCKKCNDYPLDTR
jgi:hypothetical protein